MKKDVKVFVIKAKAANGNDRTVQAITPLHFTLAEVCEMKRIPMLSIRSTTVTEPMTMNEATSYLINSFAANAFAPNTRLVKSNVTMMAI